MESTSNQLCCNFLKDIFAKRCKTAPVESPQQRKLEEYLSWQKEQQLKRCRLERYLKSVKCNDEPDEPKPKSNYSGNFFLRNLDFQT